MDVTHPNPSLYNVTVSPETKPATLILSQAYNTDWHAYDVTEVPQVARLVPFLFGKPLSGHGMVNNWENGWSLPAHVTDITIVFLPQYLEYTGFGLLILIAGALAFSHSRQNVRRAL